MKETVPEKAHRLVNTHRVILLENAPGHATAQVIGDHDCYTVRLRPHGAFCECRWFRMKGHVKPCSHILATRKAMDEPESQLPLRKLAERLRPTPAPATKRAGDPFNFR